MGRVHFQYPETKELHDAFLKMNMAYNLRHHFEKFLELSVYSLARDEEKYQEVIGKIQDKKRY